MRSLSFLFLIMTFFSQTASAESWGLVLNKSGSGNGWVCVVFDGRDECQIDDAGNETTVYLGEYVYLRATPEPGSRFVRWTGACRGQQPTCRLLTTKPADGAAISASAEFILSSTKSSSNSSKVTPTKKTPSTKKNLQRKSDKSKKKQKLHRKKPTSSSRRSS